MLKKINAGGVESDEGFSIQITHPELLEYREQNKIIEIGLGDDRQKKITYIHVSALKNLNLNEKERIIKNIREAVQFLDDSFVVV